MSQHRRPRQRARRPVVPARARSRARYHPIEVRRVHLRDDRPGRPRDASDGRGPRRARPLGPRPFRAAGPGRRPSRTGCRWRTVMVRTTIHLAEVELGARLTRTCAVFAVLGLIALLAAPFAHVPAAALAALAASWLFFAGLAAGGVALSAAARLAYGRFLEPSLQLAKSPAAFFPSALVLLAIVLAAAPRWMPAASHATITGLFVRDFGAAIVLFAAGAWFLQGSARRRWAGSRTAIAAVAYLIVYALTLSVWAIDLVMALIESAPSGI